MKRPQLEAIVMDVGDESDPVHKALFHLWAALDDFERGKWAGTTGGFAARALDRADDLLAREKA